MHSVVEGRKIVIACQGGGSHAAYAAGALKRWLPHIEASRGPDALKLAGISGTSGGALCALLAWYGHLKGGAKSASRKLDAFWQSNCAQTPGERLWNASAVAATSALPFEVSFNPAMWPLEQGVDMLTSTWPRVANALGPFNLWGRPDYFQLGRLIEQQVDFKLVNALGALLGISHDIRRWRRADIQSRMTVSLPGEDPGPLKQQLAARIGQAVREKPETIRTLMNAADFDDSSPLHAAMRHWRDDIGSDAASFGQLEHVVNAVMQHIPHLLIGAVDVENGEFVAFSSERASTDGGISLEAVLASAALPWIFKAVPVLCVGPDGKHSYRHFWDGLFSQNPPIKNFLAGADKWRIPDEFWILQINPRDYPIDQLKHGIADRRNELSGNLSLNQELSFIEAVNKRITRKGDDEHRRVQAHRIVLDRKAVERDAGIELDALSKTDRSAAIKDALMTHGAHQAEAFMRLRGAVARAWGGLDAAAFGDTFAARWAMHDSGGDKLCMHVDETILPSSAADGGPSLQATARWHARGILDDTGAGVQIEAESDIVVGADSGAITVSATRITEAKIEEHSETAALAIAARCLTEAKAGAPR